jgi:carboxylate-amine ligase
MHQSVVETGTGICKDIRAGARTRSPSCAGSLSELAKKNGLRIVAAGTHPFSDWKKQEITDGDRYKASSRICRTWPART